MQTYDWLLQGENIIFEGAANKQYYVNGINLPYNKGGKLILRVYNIMRFRSLMRKRWELPDQEARQNF